MSTPSPVSSAPASVVALAGTTVGSYRLERRLGAGGMGEVWLGRHAVSDGLGAVKLLGPKLSRRADAATLFAREQNALLRLSHPHIVPVFEVGARHIAMAYIDGASLARRLRAGIAPGDVFRMARQIASALAHAHARGVLHLDVKPSNVLTDAVGNAYLADFGAASLQEDDPEAEALVLGTPAYIAPERAHGAPVGGAADQFALARTIVAALLGTEQLPAWGSEVAALPASIPAAARAAISRAIAVDPADRFPSLAAFEEALAGCDLAGVAPHLGELEPIRDEAAYAWGSRPIETRVMAPEITCADYTLDALARDSLLAPGALAIYRAKSGLRTTGFSLFANTRTLGPAGSGWLARARHVVILVHGYAMARECWTELALALVRDNPDTVVATLDHTGFGDSRFAATPPPREHLSFAGVTRGMLAWTDLLALESLPTVFFGHSMAATGFFLVPDEAFGPHRARIILTPMFTRLLGPPRSALAAFLMTWTLRILFAIPGGYRGFFTFRTAIHANARELTPARQRSMIDQAVQVPPMTHIRLALALTTTVQARLEPLRRTYFALGLNDPEATPRVCEHAAQTLGIRPDRFRWLASGSHCPHIESVANPQGTRRNRHELVLLVDEALDEVSPSRQASTEFAATQLRTVDPAEAESAREPAQSAEAPTRAAS